IDHPGIEVGQPVDLLEIVEKSDLPGEWLEAGNMILIKQKNIEEQQREAQVNSQHRKEKECRQVEEGQHNRHLPFKVPEPPERDGTENQEQPERKGILSVKPERREQKPLIESRPGGDVQGRHGQNTGTSMFCIIQTTYTTRQRESRMRESQGREPGADRFARRSTR